MSAQERQDWAAGVAAEPSATMWARHDGWSSWLASRTGSTWSRSSGRGVVVSTCRCGGSASAGNYSGSLDIRPTADASHIICSPTSPTSSTLTASTVPDRRLHRARAERLSAQRRVPVWCGICGWITPRGADADLLRLTRL